MSPTRMIWGRPTQTGRALARRLPCVRRRGRSNLFARASTPHLSVAGDEVFVDGQFAQAHRAARVQAIGRDSGLCAEAELEAVGEAGRRVNVHGRRVDFVLKARGG